MEEKEIRVLPNEIGYGEKEYLGGYCSYKRVFDKFITDAVLCNQIQDVDSEIFYNQIAGFYDWEELRDDKLEELKRDYEEELKDGTITLEDLQDKAIEYADEEQYNYEFYQFFIIEISSYDIEYLNEIKQRTLKIMYSELLDVYVLGVDHLGTAWDYVGSDFKLIKQREE